MINIAIFASGNGSNAEKIILHFKHNPSIQVKLVVSNIRNAGVLTRAKSLDVSSIVLSKEQLNDATILEIMKKFEIDFIVLAGYLLKISSDLITEFHQKILNIHPALLPKFGGKGMYGQHVHEAVLASGEAESGISIHLVNAHYDEGEIIFQAVLPVLKTDTPSSLADKIHELEHRHYPEVIEKYVSKFI